MFLLFIKAIPKNILSFLDFEVKPVGNTAFWNKNAVCCLQKKTYVMVKSPLQGLNESVVWGNEADCMG
jgi:hypothetical protein